ncbi:exo-alpha-sialidase, partial [Citrobacter sp. AAK_AS5]
EPESLGVRAPEAPATLRRVPATGDLVLVWNDTYVAGEGHGGKRTPLTVALSSDEGATWRTVGNLESDATKTFSYTSLTFVQ